jgi:hypothetical protein
LVDLTRAYPNRARGSQASMHQGMQPADQRHLRALSSNHQGGILRERPFGARCTGRGLAARRGWVDGGYNCGRAHLGKYRYGKTPLQTFIESAPLAYKKHLDRIKPITDAVEVAVYSLCPLHLTKKIMRRFWSRCLGSAGGANRGKCPSRDVHDASGGYAESWRSGRGRGSGGRCG